MAARLQYTYQVDYLVVSYNIIIYDRLTNDNGKYRCYLTASRVTLREIVVVVNDIMCDTAAGVYVRRVTTVTHTRERE